MKCPQCGQWNRASLPNCIRCGAPLNPESAETPAWQEQFRKEDKEPKKYIHVDEDGAVDESSDRRDELATDMTELKERKVRGARRLERMKEEAAMRSAPSGATAWSGTKTNAMRLRKARRWRTTSSPSRKSGRTPVDTTRLLPCCRRTRFHPPRRA